MSNEGAISECHFFYFQIQLEAHEVEKPPGKLVSFIMKQPFAQSWFFRNPDRPEGQEIQQPVDDSRQKRQRLKAMNVWAPQNL